MDKAFFTVFRNRDLLRHITTFHANSVCELYYGNRLHLVDHAARLVPFIAQNLKKEAQAMHRAKDYRFIQTVEKLWPGLTKELLEQINETWPEPPSSHLPVPWRITSLLEKSCFHGEMEIFQRIYSSCTDLLLIYAIAGGQMDLVIHLHDKLSSMRSDFDDNEMIIAVKNKKFEIFKWLSENRRRSKSYTCEIIEECIKTLDIKYVEYIYSNLDNLHPFYVVKCAQCVAKHYNEKIYEYIKTWDGFEQCDILGISIVENNQDIFKKLIFDGLTLNDSHFSKIMQKDNIEIVDILFNIRGIGGFSPNFFILSVHKKCINIMQYAIEKRFPMPEFLEISIIKNDHIDLYKLHLEKYDLKPLPGHFEEAYDKKSSRIAEYLIETWPEICSLHQYLELVVYTGNLPKIEWCLEKIRAQEPCPNFSSIILPSNLGEKIAQIDQIFKKFFADRAPADLPRPELPGACILKDEYEEYEEWHPWYQL